MDQNEASVYDLTVYVSPVGDGVKSNVTALITELPSELRWSKMWEGVKPVDGMWLALTWYSAFKAALLYGAVPLEADLGGCVRQLAMFKANHLRST